MSTAACWTPPALARYLGVSPQKIVGWIKAGELRAINLATNPRGRRPRYRIDPAAVEAFLRGRSAAAPVATPTPRRRRIDPDVIEFF